MVAPIFLIRGTRRAESNQTENRGRCEPQSASIMSMGSNGKRYLGSAPASHAANTGRKLGFALGMLDCYIETGARAMHSMWLEFYPRIQPMS